MKKGAFIFRFLVSLILGFLPSFLFIAFFIRYGSPIQNYIGFLSDFHSSWIAWILSILLSFLIDFVWNVVKSKTMFEKVVQHKTITAIVILFLIILLTLVFAQLYLYTKFLLGSDILVGLSVDKDNLFLSSGQQENVTFKISLTTNPFCTAECDYRFVDISSGEIIEEGNFNLQVILTKTKTFAIGANNLTKNQMQIINNFQLSCKSKKTKICYTSGKEISRSVLVTANFGLSPNEEKIKEALKSDIVDIVNWASIFSINIRETQINLESSKIEEESLPARLYQINNLFYELNITNLLELWKNQDLVSISNEIPTLRKQIGEIENKEYGVYTELKNQANQYNSLASKLIDYRQAITVISKKNLTNASCEELNKKVTELNTAISNFEKKSNLSHKENIINNLNLTSYNENSDVQCILHESINQNNISEIVLTSLNKSISGISLEEPVQFCCYYGNCGPCCDEKCSGRNYPVLLLHGHSINKALPADYSLDALAKLKQDISSLGYLDAGVVTISKLNNSQGVWGRTDVPIEVTGSYYFDVYHDGNKETIVSSKVDSIDTYAIRLRSLINTIKSRTGKDKVIIIAHSMGGLVTRRYAQVFGSKDINKIILIGTPNHGIDEKVESYCSLFGPKTACHDMGQTSILINALNNEPSEKTEIHNIIGIGCDMGTETGDGIVKNSSQWLEKATNYYVNGSCNELKFYFLHEAITDPGKYPEVFEIVKSILKI